MAAVTCVLSRLATPHHHGCKQWQPRGWDTRTAPESHQWTTSTRGNLWRCSAEQGDPSRKAECSEGCRDLPPRSTSELPPSCSAAAPPAAPRATGASHGCHCPLQSPEEHAARPPPHRPLRPASPHRGCSTKSHPTNNLSAERHLHRGSTGNGTGDKQGLCPHHPVCHPSWTLPCQAPIPAGAAWEEPKARAESVLSHSHPSSRILSQEAFHLTARMQLNVLPRAEPWPRAAFGHSGHTWLSTVISG